MAARYPPEKDLTIGRREAIFPPPEQAIKIANVTATPTAIVDSAATAKKAAAAPTTDTVTLSAEARAAAADGLPIFATPDTSGAGSIADVATKLKSEERAKADNSKADTLESQFLDEQATKMDKLDRLDGRARREEEVKKDRIRSLDEQGIREEQLKKDKSVRFDGRAKDEESQKAIRTQSVTEKFAGTDELAVRLDRLKEQGAVEEQKKKAQVERSVDRGIREDTQKGDQVGNVLARAKDEEAVKARQIDRLGSKYKDEASQKSIRVQKAAETGSISPTEAKELTALIDRNVEERQKALEPDRATTDTTTDSSSATSKPGLGGTATSMANAIQYAADRDNR